MPFKKNPPEFFYNYIVVFYDINRRYPTMDEIAEGMDVVKNTVWRKINKLVEMGRLVRTNNGMFRLNDAKLKEIWERTEIE